MVRRLFRDSAIYGASGLLSQGIAFLLFPFLAHTLHPRAYGVIDIVGLLMTIALLTVALEISQGLGRMVAGNDDAADRGAYASTALIWSVASYSVFALIALALAEPLTKVLLGEHVNAWVTRAAVGWIWFAGALYVVQDQLRWQMRPKAFAGVSVVVATVTTGSVAVYVFALHGAALGVVAGQMTGAASGLVVALALSPGIYRLRFEWERARAMLAFSIPLVPSSIGVFLNGYADRLAIQHQESLAAVGVYGVGFRVAIVVSLLLLGVQGATMPLILARHQDPETPADLARSFRFFWAAGCGVFLVLSVLAEPLVRLLAAPEYFGAARVVPFLVGAGFLAGLYVFAPGPTIARRTRVYVPINVGAGLLNLGLAFALVPSLGILGAAIATLVSSAVVFAGSMGASQRLYPAPHEWVRLLAGAGAAILVVVIARTLLITDRSQALHAAPVLERLVICALGSLLVAGILVTTEALDVVGRRVRRRRA